MYSSLPRRQRFLIRGALALAWSLVALSGVTTLMFGADAFLQDIFGLVVVATSVLAAVGVATNRYRWEWVSAWFAAGGIVPYIVAAIADAYQGGPEHLPMVFLLAALAAFFSSRALHCAAHAAKLRAQHETHEGDRDAAE